jgi:tetratricopeptide (TPR) repeat protein
MINLQLKNPLKHLAEQNTQTHAKGIDVPFEVAGLREALRFLRRFFLCIATVVIFLSNTLLVGAITTSVTNSVCKNDKFAEAAAFQAVGQYEKALTRYDELIAKGGNANLRAALNQKGNCFYQLRRYSDAVQCWECVLKHRAMLASGDDIALKLAVRFPPFFGQVAKRGFE